MGSHVPWAELQNDPLEVVGLKARTEGFHSGFSRGLLQFPPSDLKPGLGAVL